ncbi:hypothetical protein GOP47_0018058 [Adiantum capillus-veneris]|uniref:Uncharacterized protein n=1 Tax=Adiantum capillus-veneris TaxID=13818 RepID=A0A9D4UGT7_ADICA|nr:hypothetical protein GOP47_0018058 [Adiantum capillus-veneris]
MELQTPTSNSSNITLSNSNIPGRNDTPICPTLRIFAAWEGALSHRHHFNRTPLTSHTMSFLLAWQEGSVPVPSRRSITKWILLSIILGGIHNSHFTLLEEERHLPLHRCCNSFIDSRLSSSSTCRPIRNPGRARRPQPTYICNTTLPSSV